MIKLFKNIIGIIISIVTGIIIFYVLLFLISKNILPDYLKEIIILVILLAVTYLVSRFLGSIIFYTMVRYGEPNAKHIKSAFEIIFFLLVFFIIFLSFGNNITAGLVSAGLIGIILGVAAQSTLSNFFAGLYILISRPFEVGQRINIVISQYPGYGPTYPHDFLPPKYVGVVDEIGFLYTRIINDENHILTVPNSIFLQAMISELPRPYGRDFCLARIFGASRFSGNACFHMRNTPYVFKHATCRGIILCERLA
ncbi:MAG: mechanosensitive ion channel family protein [Thermoplasmata archaeon]